MIWSVGHGTASEAGLLAVVGGAGIRTVVDVRRFPGSRRHPQFGREPMATWLADGGVAYRWLEALGGRRRPVEGSPNVALRNPQLRAYADHMASIEFARSVAELVELAASSPAAVLCSESVWWRCHRRLLADHLVLVEGVEVEHLFHDGHTTAHPVTPGARRAGRHLVYDDVD